MVRRFLAGKINNKSRIGKRRIAAQWIEFHWAASINKYVEIGNEVNSIICWKVGFGHQLLIVCLAYRKRTIPTRVKHVKGHSKAKKQLALLAYVRSLIPAAAAVFLVGDSDFGSVAVLQQLDRWRWFYVLRQKADTGVWFREDIGWQTFGSYIHQSGQSFWLRVFDDQRDLSGQLVGSLESE